MQYHVRQGGDTWVITVNPRHRNYYRKVLGFVPLGPRRSYPAVRDHPAEAFLLDVGLMRANAPAMHREVFGEPLPDGGPDGPRTPGRARPLLRRALDPGRSPRRSSSWLVEHFGSPPRWREARAAAVGTAATAGRRERGGLMWLLAIKAMLADRGKLLTSLLGVAFSVVLVNLQGGLLLGLIRKASLLVDYGQADIWVGHRHMNNVDMGTFIPERWVHRIRGVEGVERAEPYIVMFGQIDDARRPVRERRRRRLRGGQPAGQRLGHGRGGPRAIRDPDGILVDVYDARPARRLPRSATSAEINGHRARVVGMTEGIVGFTTNPYVFTTLDRARATTAATSASLPTTARYFLVKAKPGVDITALCARIRERVAGARRPRPADLQPGCAWNTG